MKITKKQIKEWNEYFNSLTPAQKRVAIAKDVIEQVKAEKYFARNRTYIDFYNKLEGEIQSNFNKVKCECCALGAMFLSDVKYTNQCTFEQAKSTSFSFDEENRLRNYFDVEQLILIEAAFECWSSDRLLDYDEHTSGQIRDGFGYDLVMSNLSITEDDLDNAANFGNKYDDSSERLIKIMENIVKNKGKFKL
jgi:hypothetical protein